MQVSPRYLLQPADIEAALAWRLDGLEISEIETIAEVFRPFVDDFREDRLEVAKRLTDLHRPGDRRSAWSLASAVLAWDALRRNDLLTFASAVGEVIAAMRQGKRGSHTNRKRCPSPDALDDDISELHGGRSADALFDAFASCISDCVVEFDAGKGELVCQLDPESETLTNVGRAEFARRVRRLR